MKRRRLLTFCIVLFIGGLIVLACVKFVQAKGEPENWRKSEMNFDDVKICYWVEGPEWLTQFQILEDDEVCLTLEKSDFLNGEQLRGIIFFGHFQNHQTLQ